MRTTHYVTQSAQHVQQLQSQIILVSQQWQLIGYVLFTLGIIVEGDAVLFTAGFVSHQGIFNPILMFVWLLAGGTVGDILWYKLGEFLEPYDNRVVRWLKTVTNPLGRHLLEHPKKSLFLSKFLYGVNHAILCKAGALHIPLKRFIRDDLPANIFWILIIGGLGYASSAGVVHIRHSIRYAELGLVVGLILLMIISRIFTHYFKKKL